MCRWVSIMPGITMPPVASISWVPSGTWRRLPTSAMRSSTTSTSASVSTVEASSIVRTVPPRNTSGRPLCGAASDMVIVSSWLRWHERTGVRTAVSGRRRPPSCRPERPVKRAGSAPLSWLTAIPGRQQTRDGRTSGSDHMQEARGMTTGQGTGSGPLAGLLVADFSRILAGPYATMLLADLGAEVVKVEGPGGDDTRTWLPPTRDGVATYYLRVNRNKRSIALDLKNDDDARVARELARRADVMIENFRPGGLRRFGLDYDTVAKGNSKIIYSSISGFGSGEKGAALP